MKIRGGGEEEEEEFQDIVAPVKKNNATDRERESYRVRNKRAKIHSFIHSIHSFRSFIH